MPNPDGWADSDENPTTCGEGPGELGCGGLQLTLTLCNLPDGPLILLVAGGEVADRRFEPADHTVETGRFESHVAVPPLAGVGFALHLFGELTGGLAAVPTSLTVLSEPVVDLATLGSGSGQPGDRVTNGCIPVSP